MRSSQLDYNVSLNQNTSNDYSFIDNSQVNFIQNIPESVPIQEIVYSLETDYRLG